MTGKGQDHPQIHRMVHPPVLALFYIIIAFLFGIIVPVLFVPTVLLRNIGFGLTIVGLLFGMSALIELRKAGTTLDPHGSARKLVTSGIYRFSRNPIYLGYLLMVIGFPLILGSYVGVLMMPIFALTMNRLVIEKEEAYLESKFQGQYANYKSRVRRWL